MAKEVRTEDRICDGPTPWYADRRPYYERTVPVTIRLWLDDLREPPDTSWTWAPNSAWAIKLLKAYRCVEISFDFDLGEGDTAQIVADWMEREIAENGMPLPKWSIHSANPVGRSFLALTMGSCQRLADR